MKEPTEAQIKELWERCGLNEQPSGSWYTDSGEYVYMQIVPIDLNNLFKYAVPKLDNLSLSKSRNNVGWRGYEAKILKVCCEEPPDYTYFTGKDEDPALALFWAIWKVFNP